MSDQELKDLVASLAVAQKEVARQMEESNKRIEATQQETARQMEESSKRIEATQQETARQMEESSKRIEATQQEAARQIKQTQKQLGELGNKWGTFTEGMAIASIQKILLEEFKIPVISQNVVKRMNGETIEMDAFGYENSTVNTAVIVEIKSHLKDSAIEQLEEIMANFPKFFPEHADKKLHGIIACVHAPDSIKNLLRKKGIYLTVHNDIFELYPFKNFTPKDFNRS
ncbi:MAG: DUF3782 domain-containing protein [Saprospiraceae bacterium]|nr:DUF3782 domain-containing protein [Saprospiraceae bacterium]